MQLTDEDIGFGFPYGPAAQPIDFQQVHLPADDPLAALELVIRPHVEAGRCFVSFSGGVDSSLVLAVATSLARRTGAPDPVPVSWRFDSTPDTVRARETPWQEAVVAELGLTEWVRLEAGEQLGWTGPVATDLLSAFGLLYPANTYLHAPLARQASGGSLLTGIGGDQVLGLWRRRDLAGLLAGRRGPEIRDLRRAGVAALPPALRRALGQRSAVPELPRWLTAAAQHRYRRLAAAERLDDPLRWDRHLAWRLGRRDVAFTLGGLQAISSHHDCQVVAPLFDPRCVAALARAGGRWGAGNRADTVERWFPDALPRAVRGRPDKASFNEVFWRAPSAEQAATRLADDNGQTLGPLIDVDGLAAEWSSPRPSAQTGLLFQQHWLAQQRCVS